MTMWVVVDLKERSKQVQLPRVFFKLYLHYNPGGNNCSLDFLHIAEEKTFYTPIINNLNYFHYEDEQFEHREWQEVCSSYD